MSKKEKKIIIILTISLILIDQILKIVSINKTEINIEPSSNNTSYILISIIAIIVIIRYMLNNNSFIKINSRIILSFAIAGALSNVIDRIWFKSVINYINIKEFHINLSYIYIVIAWIGMAIILTRYTINRNKEKRNLSSGDKNNNSSK